jgi:hypothetical protein
MDTPIATPETDAAAGTLTGVNLCAAFETKCRQLEMQKNELRALMAELVALQDDCGCVYRTSPIMDRIKASLENAEVEIPRERNAK